MADVPTFTDAVIGRDIGMDNAEQGAGENWTEYAVAWIRAYTLVFPNTTFRTEHVRTWAYSQGCPPPKSNNDKAWGPAMKRAQKEQIIDICGTSAALSSHLSPKMLWKATKL